jgi:hypothetical protein
MLRSPRMRRQVLVAVCVAGCGRLGFDATTGAEPEVGPPQVVDGSRLKAWYHTSGSTKLFGGWTDTKLGIDCAFDDDGSGQLRCIPVGAYNGSIMRLFVSTYSDTACTTPSFAAYAPARDGACQPPPPMFAHADGIFAVDGAITGQAYVRGAMSCIAFTAFPVQYALSSRVESSEFVAAVVEEQGTERLRLRTFVGADGSRQAFEIYDTAYGLVCNPTLRPDHEVACELVPPPDTASRDLSINDLHTKIFADAACTIPAAHTSSTPSPTVITDRQRSTCAPGSIEEYDVGPVLPAAWSYGDGRCTPVVSGMFYGVGAHRRTLVPAIGSWSPTGDDRLHPVIMTIGGLTMTRGVWDELVGAECSPELDDAASWRCLPVASGPSEPVHRMPDCSDPYVLGHADCGEARWSGRLDSITPQPSCLALGVTRRSSSLTSSEFYRRTQSGCLPAGEPMHIDDATTRAATDFAPLALQFPDGR